MKKSNKISISPIDPNSLKYVELDSIDPYYNVFIESDYDLPTETVPHTDRRRVANTQFVFRVFGKEQAKLFNSELTEELSDENTEFGLYILENVENGSCYIGQSRSQNVFKRATQHENKKEFHRIYCISNKYSENSLRLDWLSDLDYLEAYLFELVSKQINCEHMNGLQLNSSRKTRQSNLQFRPLLNQTVENFFKLSLLFGLGLSTYGKRVFQKETKIEDTFVENIANKHATSSIVPATDNYDLNTELDKNPTKLNYPHPSDGWMLKASDFKNYTDFFEKAVSLLLTKDATLLQKYIAKTSSISKTPFISTNKSDLFPDIDLTSSYRGFKELLVNGKKLYLNTHANSKTKSRQLISLISMHELSTSFKLESTKDLLTSIALVV